ncbi:zinc finger CCCH domain-containing protein 6-like [Cajanus cajan]|uniref:zinc finger CCCH domain-containing protein 6-like n=1 Tax=Cajanus cajan TaxID=3821 RepID=UPI00098DA62F|nr:zinc finger CCCH domain-containing protein 6-like [Cajanus cajan]
MKRSSSRKFKRVSWASGSNLRQVKFFLPDDCPSKVGSKLQGKKTLSKWPYDDEPPPGFEGKHLQKQSPSTTTDEYDDIPPGFEGKHLQNQSKAVFPHIPRIKWECPPLIALNKDLHVAAGQDSMEKHYQKRREKKVPETVFPGSSAIPSWPIVSSDVEEESYDDRLTPKVSLIPIELRKEEYEEDSELESDDSVARPTSPPPPTHQDLKGKAPASASVPSKQGVTKDVDYYRNLVRSRSTSQRDMLDSPTSTIHQHVRDSKRPRDNISMPKEVIKSKSKIQCKFFNSSKGCRNASKCPYKHDTSAPKEKILRL